MPLHTLFRTTAALALAVPTLVGLSAVAVSADEVETAPVTVVVEQAAPTATTFPAVDDDATVAPAPVTGDEAPAPAPTVQDAPPLMSAAYTRW